MAPTLRWARRTAIAALVAVPVWSGPATLARTKTPGGPPSPPSESAPGRGERPASKSRDAQPSPGAGKVKTPIAGSPTPEPTPATLRSVSTEEMAGLLQEAQVAILDSIESLLRAQAELVNVEGGYKKVTPPYLEEAREAVARSSARLVQAKNTEIPERLVELSRAGLLQLSEALQLKLKAVREAKQLDGWGPSAVELDDRATAMFKRGVKTNSALMEVLLEARLPKGFRDTLLEPLGMSADLPKDGTGFTLGVGVRASEPMVVFRVKPGSVASRLELQVGDRILAVNRQPVVSLVEAKLQLKKVAGEYAFITVERRGKEETFSRRVLLRAR